MSNLKRLISALTLVAVLLAAGLCALAEDAPTGNGENETETTDTTSTTTTDTTTTDTTTTDATEKTGEDANVVNREAAADGAKTEVTPDPAATTHPTPKPVVTATVYLTSSADRLPLFKNKSASTSELGLFAGGTTVIVLERAADWCYVQVGSLKGYMQTAFLRFASTTPTASPTPAPYYAYIKTPSEDALDLHEKPEGGSKVLGSYYSGTRVYVFESTPGWSKVQIDGVTGYMVSEYIVRTVTATPTPATVTTYALVNNPNPKDRLNLRAAANTGSASLGRYYNGTEVKVLEKGATWSRVEVQGKAGYMMTQYLIFAADATASPSASPSALPTVVPMPTTGTVIYAVVNNSNPLDRLNLRAEPSLDSTVLGRFYNGTQIKVTGLDTIWSRVEVSGLSGYMMTQYLSFNGIYVGDGTTGGKDVSGSYVNAVVSNPVATQRLHLRAGTSTGTASLGLYYNGTQVKVYDKGTDWSQVTIGNKTGYMMTKYLSFNGSVSSTSPTIGIVTNPISTQRLNLRSYPSTGSLSLGQFANGTRVTILSYDADWCKVQINGTTGYMMTKYLLVK